MSKHICSKNKRNEKEASCILHWHGPNRYKNGKIYILGSSKKLPGLGGLVTGWVKHLRVGLWPNQSLWKSRSVAFTKMKRNCFNCGMIITKGNLWRLNCKMCPWQYKNNSIFCYPGSDAQLQCIRLHLPRFGGANIRDLD